MHAIQTAILHYSGPPVVGGVEAVIESHAQVFGRAGYPVAVVAGRGEKAALPAETGFALVPEMDTQHPDIESIGAKLEQGYVPAEFDAVVAQQVEVLRPILGRFDNVIVHNILTKRFNLPLTVALHTLIEEGAVGRTIAWCHDIGWTSASSREKLHPGYPWDLLRTRLPQVTYVVVSQSRQRALATLFDCSPEEIRVVYNGVDPRQLLALSEEGAALVDRLGLLDSDLILLMPVRVTQAKNIEHALRVVRALKDRACRPKLVLTGPPDPHDAGSMAYFSELRALREQLDVEAEMRFVFESGPDPDEPYFVGMDVVADLFRVSDVMLMPSHREGFGMPVLEAGLVGLPVISTPVPAAAEIGGDDVTLMGFEESPEETAERILEEVAAQPAHRFRRRVRQDFTWQALFDHDIRPLIDPKESE